MNELAIRVSDLSKEYRLGGYSAGSTLRDSLARLAAAPLRKKWGSRRTAEEDGDKRVWALHDISFEVRTGEIIGLIGRNGAGKSTLLRVLARITQPTSGMTEIWGRIGSILEVGTGFHSELSGRENIFLSGAMLGMSRSELTQRLEQIVAFAELDRFIDTPVKYYSSGMYMRLAFSVAAHLEPDVLLVDEVLAVGDTAFQRKCLGKMDEVASHDRTVIFVSHNMAAVEALTDRCLLLESGRLVEDGQTGSVISRYFESLDQKDAAVDLRAWTARQGSREARVVSLSLHDAEGREASIFKPGELIEIVLGVECDRDRLLDAAVIIENSMQVPIFATYLSDRSEPIAASPYQKLKVRISPNYLKQGQYRLTVAALGPGRDAYDLLEHLPGFEIQGGTDLGGVHGRLGDLYIPFDWQVETTQ